MSSAAKVGIFMLIILTILGYFILKIEDIRPSRKGTKTVVAIFDEYYRYFQPFEGIEFLRAMADRNRFIRAWTTFMADYPLVLTPFLPAPIFTLALRRTLANSSSCHWSITK